MPRFLLAETRTGSIRRWMLEHERRRAQRTSLVNRMTPDQFELVCPASHDLAIGPSYSCRVHYRTR